MTRAQHKPRRPSTAAQSSSNGNDGDLSIITVEKAAPFFIAVSIEQCLTDGDVESEMMAIEECMLATYFFPSLGDSMVV